MSGTSQPIFPQALYTNVCRFTDTDGSTIKTVASGGTNGLKIYSLTMSNKTNLQNGTRFYFHNTSTGINYVWTSIRMPVNAGGNITNGDQPVSLEFDVNNETQIPPYPNAFQLPVDVNGNKYLYIASGWELRANIYFDPPTTSTSYVTMIVTGALF
jgi:hypothetical protein